MNIIISIKPFYAEKILNWEKTYELRRSFSKKEIKKVIIYKSAPISRIVGEFEIDHILYEGIDQLWKDTKDYSSVDREFFDKYFQWKEKWYAIKIKNVKKYEKSKLVSKYWVKFAPQNYCFY